MIHFPIIVFNVNDVNGSDSIQVHNETNSNNYIVVDTYMTWHEAKSYCESQDGHLVTITSDAEQTLVHSLIQGRIYGVWIGLSDERSEGTWEWITGEELNYTNWENGEPIGVDYAMVHDGSGEWDSPFESETLPFVCEWGDYQNSKTEYFPPIVDRILLFLFFVGVILGMAYYNRKMGQYVKNF